MLMPQELRKYAFNHAIRGYSTAEVDEYIEFLCTKYEEVYRENDELERKLEAALRTLDEVKSRETKITALDAEVKRVSARMLAQAEAQKKRIVTDAEEYADRIIADADAHVAEQAQVLEAMRQSVLAFRDDLYARYSQQIDQIEALAAAAQGMTGVQVPAEVPAEPHVPPVSAEEIPEEPETADAPDEALDEVGDTGEAEPEELPEESAEEEVPEEAEPAEEPADADAEEDADESIEELFAPQETDEAGVPDGIDEHELAETDEALLFFETITDADGDAGYAQVDEDTCAQAQEEKAETEFVYDGDISDEDGGEAPETADDDDDDEVDEDAYDGAGEAEDVEPEEFEVLFPIIEETTAEDEAESPEESAEESEETDESAESDESADSADWTESTAEPYDDEESDEKMLQELRQAFNIQFETFTTETSEGKEEEDASFAFLEEPELEDEPVGLLERLKNAMDKEKNAGKKETKEKDKRR